jgi:predicted restriction endonuclease
MSLEHIKRLIDNKYNELYDIFNINKTNSDIHISNELEYFIYDLLEKYNKNKVMYFIKELFDIEFKDDIEEELQLQVSRNDDEFRKAVKEKYKNCIICDINDCHKASYQVAHIYDFAKCENIQERYDINNGLLMCSNMHKYFDDSLLKFVIDIDSNDNYLAKIVFCDSMINYGFYKKYNGKTIQFNKQNILYIEKKNNSI